MKWLSNSCVWLIDFYRRYLSRLKPSCCRFTPTCSEYAREAFSQFNPVYALWLTIRRILRCHPFYHGSLYDPVPPRRKNNDRKQ